MTQIVPFPLAKRVGFIRKHAELALSMTPSGSDGHIDRQIEIQRQALLRKGCEPRCVDRECDQLEGAIRGAMWARVMTPGGAA